MLCPGSGKNQLKKKKKTLENLFFRQNLFTYVLFYIYMNTWVLFLFVLVTVTFDNVIFQHDYLLTYDFSFSSVSCFFGLVPMSPVSPDIKMLLMEFFSWLNANNARDEVGEIWEKV